MPPITLKFFSRIQSFVHQALQRSRLSDSANSDCLDFTFSGNTSIAQDIKDHYGYDGCLLNLFAENRGRLIHKWHHYIPLYDYHFSRFRNSQVRLLEIGVSGGGSLAMWRQYFGDKATIFGIDINPKCLQYNDSVASVRIGSQDDSEFLAGVVREMGGVDIVIDDGSHVMNHVRKSFDTLYPLMSEGGVYLVEDLHTAYWKAYSGAGRGANFFDYIREFVDDIHSPYHRKGKKYPAISSFMSGIHIYDSIVVFDKRLVYLPVNSQVPQY